MDTVNYLQFFLAFVLVVGLIGLTGALLRRYGNPDRLYGTKGIATRLKVIETRYVDARRKLVLVARDNREHLLLLAEGREVVIESLDAKAPDAAQDKTHD